jgi:DNA-binding transcriptional MerR regulator
MLESMSVVTGLTIAEAARASGVSAYTLRYYERAGLIGNVGRADSGHRRYSDEDLAWIHVLQCLRATGMPIRDIRRYAELARGGEATERDRLALLQEHRARRGPRSPRVHRPQDHRVQGQASWIDENWAVRAWKCLPRGSGAWE